MYVHVSGTFVFLMALTAFKALKIFSSKYYYITYRTIIVQ